MYLPFYKSYLGYSSWIFNQEYFINSFLILLVIRFKCILFGIMLIFKTSFRHNTKLKEKTWNSNIKYYFTYGISSHLSFLHTLMACPLFHYIKLTAHSPEKKKTFIRTTTFIVLYKSEKNQIDKSCDDFY